MSRNVQMIRPQELKSDDLGGIVTIMEPKDALQPILPAPVRSAVHQWMTELRAEEELQTVKVEPRRSALLSGPPGCGKTTLAHHLAARLNYNLICVHMDRLRSQYMGETGRNIAELFGWMKCRSENSIVFFDEFDALATQRSEVRQAGDREANAIVDSLLQRIEQFKGILIAATNRADCIDPAIWRRFGMQLEIPLPGPDERFAIIKLYLDPFDFPDSDIDFLTAATNGAAPSLLRQLIEGLKRDLILAPRMGMDTGPLAVFERLTAAIKAHSDYTQPPLWECRDTFKKLENLSWPPKRKEH